MEREHIAKVVDIKIQCEPAAAVPEYADDGCSGADVFAHVGDDVRIGPGMVALIPTGIRAEIPSGYEIQVRPRSGLALKNGITVLNTPGTVDSSYRGEIGVILVNHSSQEFIVKPNMKIAQLVCTKVEKMNFLESTLSSTTRGEKGYGSTGL